VGTCGTAIDRHLACGCGWRQHSPLRWRQRHPILTIDAQKIDIGTEEVESLLNYCEHLAMFKQGGEEFSESQDEFQSVLANAGERNGLLMASSKYRTFMGLDTSRDKKPRKADNPRVGMR
jgi:hypothetical protein